MLRPTVPTVEAREEVNLHCEVKRYGNFADFATGAAL